MKPNRREMARKRSEMALTRRNMPSERSEMATKRINSERMAPNCDGMPELPDFV